MFKFQENNQTLSQCKRMSDNSGTMNLTGGSYKNQQELSRNGSQRKKSDVDCQKNASKVIKPFPINDKNCSICLGTQTFTEIRSLPCVHKFHAKCINNWLKFNKSCSVCQSLGINFLGTSQDYDRRQQSLATNEQHMHSVAHQGVNNPYRSRRRLSSSSAHQMNNNTGTLYEKVLHVDASNKKVRNSGKKGIKYALELYEESLHADIDEEIKGDADLSDIWEKINEEESNEISNFLDLYEESLHADI